MKDLDNKIYESIDFLRDDILEKADSIRQIERKQSVIKRIYKKTPIGLKLGASFLAFLLAVVLIISSINPLPSFALTHVEYPDYFDGVSHSYSENINAFYQKFICDYLSGYENENMLISPTNIYMSLAITSAIADGKSKSQILDFLGDDVESIENNAKIMFRTNYQDSENFKVRLANALFLSDNNNYNMDTLTTLCEKYYGESYSGKMGSHKYNKALDNWIKENTFGKIAKSGKHMDSDTSIMIATTQYFEGEFQNKFDESHNKTAAFYISQNNYVNCTFMYKPIGIGKYYSGDDFEAICDEMSNGYAQGARIWYILPEEGKSINDVSKSVTKFILDNDKSKYKNKDLYGDVNLGLPKFTISQENDLSSLLKSNGITDVFDSDKADFSQLTHANGSTYISDYISASTLTVNERGCKAASYTEQFYQTNSAIPLINYSLDFDRPFIVVVTGSDNMPMYVGVVQNPTK